MQRQIIAKAQNIIAKAPNTEPKTKMNYLSHLKFIITHFKPLKIGSLVFLFAPKEL